MADDTARRAKRLVMFRELQRDRASREVKAAMASKESAQNAVQDQETLISNEAAMAQPGNGESKSVQDIQLDLAYVDALREELGKKRALLREAAQKLNAKSKVLLATHKKVRQMEAIKEKAVREERQRTKKKEQFEIDDLSANREARQ